MLQITIPLCYAGLSGWLLLRDPPARRGLVLAALALVLAAHAYQLATTLGGHAAVRLSVGEFLSLIGFAVALAASAGATRARSKVLAGASLVLAALLSAAIGVGTGEPSSAAPGWPLLAHVAFSIISYALLSIAAVTALLLASKHRALKSSPAVPAMRVPVSIEALEYQLFGAIGAGFACLSLAIFSGFIYVDDLFAQHLAHKTILTLAAWALFGVLLVGRWRFGWRAQTAVRWTLTGFAVLLLAYFGSRIVLESILGRHWG